MFSTIKIFYSECKKVEHFSEAIQQLKYYFRWSKSLLPGSNSLKDEQPWITYEVIDFLKMNLSNEDIVFEYGGGGSTLFFVKHVKEVITVEHNEEWHTVLSDMISKRQITNWKGRFIEAGKGDLFPDVSKDNPDHYSSGDAPSKGKNYRDYVCAIDQFNDNYFDVILVDGRSRPSCISHSIPKLKKGGYLILDNSDRNYYLTFLNKILNDKFDVIIDSIGASPYSKEFTKTTVWKRK
jgi:predicted O-methyltransferase YrrM